MCIKEVIYKIFDRVGVLIMRVLLLYDRDCECYEERQFLVVLIFFKNEGDDSGMLGRGKENGVKWSS